MPPPQNSLLNSFPPELIKTITAKYDLNDLLACGASSCAWLTADNRVCKLTESTEDAEMALRIANVQLIHRWTGKKKDNLVDIFAVVDEIIAIDYARLDKRFYLTIMERLQPIVSQADKEFIWQYTAKGLNSDLPAHINFTDLQYLIMTVDAFYEWIWPRRNNFEVLLKKTPIKDIITQLKHDRNIFNCLPDAIMAIVVGKFKRLYGACNRLVISGETVSGGSALGPSLLDDAYSANWGLRDPSDFKSMVLYDFGGSHPLHNSLNKLPLQQF